MTMGDILSQKLWRVWVGMEACRGGWIRSRQGMVAVKCSWLNKPSNETPRGGGDWAISRSGEVGVSAGRGWGGGGEQR